jgi:hypothetical protein
MRIVFVAERRPDLSRAFMVFDKIEQPHSAADDWLLMADS